MPRIILLVQQGLPSTIYHLPSSVVSVLMQATIVCSYYVQRAFRPFSGLSILHRDPEFDNVSVSNGGYQTFLSPGIGVSASWVGKIKSFLLPSFRLLHDERTESTQAQASQPMSTNSQSTVFKGSRMNTHVEYCRKVMSSLPLSTDIH